MSATPQQPPADPRWDKNLWAATQMADACMKLGAILLDPTKPPVGFSPPEPRDRP